jgi:methyl-accepting chemotaxis protein
VLGTVSVRSYLARKVIHTIVLLLLKVRMEPMLSLRATVGSLARGVMDLSPRARVKSDDEFGELATDLNHFLDRIALIVHDLDRILSEVVAVGERLGSVNRHLERPLGALLQRLTRGRQATDPSPPG